MSYTTRKVETRGSVGTDTDGKATVHLQLTLSGTDDRDMDQAHFHTIQEIEQTARELAQRAKTFRRALKAIARQS